MARSNRRRVTFVLASAFPLLAACNAIVGISDYQKAECSGGGACLGDSSTTTEGGRFDAGDASDANVNRIDAQGTPPVSWAQFKMPNYADAGTDVNVPVYTATTGGGVKDGVSGLVWRPVDPKDKVALTFTEAKALCAGVEKGRLPTRIELVSLLDFSKKAAPTANPIFGLEAEKYWTTSAFRDLGGPTTDNLVVGFDGASANVISKVNAEVGENGGKARAICILGL